MKTKKQPKRTQAGYQLNQAILTDKNIMTRVGELMLGQIIINQINTAISNGGTVLVYILPKGHPEDLPDKIEQLINEAKQ